MVEDLFGGHPEFIASSGNFQPAFFVFVIFFCEVFGANKNLISVIGQFHTKSILA